MIASEKILPLILIAILGHSMALFWLLAARSQFKLYQTDLRDSNK